MLTYHRLRRARGNGDAGLSLMELVVTMGIATIVGTIATMFFVNAYKTGYKSISTNQNTADARITLDSWTSMLRVADFFDPINLRSNNVADRFEEITPTKIVFYASLGNRPAGTVGDPVSVTKVALFLNPSVSDPTHGELVQVLFNTDNVTPKSVRVLGFNASQSTDAATGSTKWFFTPYNKSGGQLSTSTAKCLNAANQPVVGYCYQPTGATGTYDPTLQTGTHTVIAGNLHGDGTANTTLANVGRIDISIRIANVTNTTINDFSSSVAVNSVFPS